MFKVIIMSAVLLTALSHIDGKPDNSSQNRIDKCSYDKVLLRLESCFRPASASQDEVWGRKPVTTLDGLEARLRRSMESLSIRVLRGVRRIESMVKETERGSTSDTDEPDPKKYAESRAMKTDTESGRMNDMPPCNSETRIKDMEKSCPDMFVTVDGWDSCYLFSKFNTTWHRARDICSAVDANLVAIETEREQQLINLLIKQKSSIDDAFGWWNSGNHVSQSQQWMWTSQLHLKPTSFVYWANRKEPVDVGAMKCMFLSEKHEYQWINDMCTRNYNFICEKSKNG